MPGFKEYVDVESGVKLLVNLLPEDVDHLGEDAWKSLSDAAAQVHQNVTALLAAATGSQKKLADDLKGIAEDLETATAKILDEAGKAAGATEEEAKEQLEKIAPEIATIRGAIKALPDHIQQFDEKKLKSKRFIFG
jgi:division protein CdvB (Snf7/Vps24/ESCRT-III family)